MYVIVKLVYLEIFVSGISNFLVVFFFFIICLGELYLDYVEVYFEYNGILEGDVFIYFNLIC